MFRFPLWLGLAGAVLPVATFIEGILPLLWLSPRPTIQARDWEQLFEFWTESAKYGVPVGVVMGLIAIVVCFSRHGRDGSTNAKRFELNLRWCLLLALLLIGFNDALFYAAGKTFGWLSLRGSIIYVLFAPVVLAGVLNFVAVMWAIARTIGSDDVLTPRVLVEKMRRSARLEESR